MERERLDELFMKKALTLAKRGLGRTSPNPAVGAVIVRDGKVVGEGYHRAAGEPHAEVNAIRDAGELTRGATLYVTLEPCNHHGKTPPCTHAILKAGIKRVVVGMRDPNPHVKGGGCDFLVSSGVDVTCGVLEQECRLINQPFIKHVTTGLPYVIVKAAITLDGCIATRTGHSKWITNEKSRRFVHKLRFLTDGVCVGIGTVLADNPRLTVRNYRPGRKKKNVRIILDSRLRTPEGSELVKSASGHPLWIFHGPDADRDKRRVLEQLGVKFFEVEEANAGGLALNSVLRLMAENGILSVLVEGGSRVIGSFFAYGLVDEIYFFYAPKILADSRGRALIGGGRVCNVMTDAVKIYDLRVRTFLPEEELNGSPDVLLCGRVRKEIY